MTILNYKDIPQLIKHYTILFNLFFFIFPDCVDLSGKWNCSGSVATFEQDGCTGSTTDGYVFTVKESNGSFTDSAGVELFTATVNQRVTEIKTSEGDTCTKESGNTYISKKHIF